MANERGVAIDPKVPGAPVDLKATGAPVDPKATGAPVDPRATGAPVDPVVNLARSLQRAESFEAAAELAMGALLDACDATLARSPFASRARMLRAAVHVRPAGAYERLASRERVSGDDGSPYTHSARAWRWVRERAQPVAMDVHLGLVSVHDGTAFVQLEDGTTPAMDSNETQKRLLGRDASHLLVMPLRAPGAEVVGMISVEADARPAMGTHFVWEQVVGLAETLAGVAAPHLLALPLRGASAPPHDPLLPVVGVSMRSVVEMLRVFAQQEETILLSGPTGAGKSRLATWCHRVSRRSGEPFETLDLSTVPEQLQMAELFGWKKGAFTDANRDTPGVLTRAEGGTLFIDEVDKLSLKAQAGLLRVLEERLYRPLGEGARERTADVRFVVGTNAALQQNVRAGTFRADLYYRIHVLPLRVPALAERADEIPAWATFMLRRRHAETGARSEAALTPEAERMLSAQPWPGNLRQLDNIVRRAYALFLVEAGPTPARIDLGATHVERALLYDGAVETKSVIELLQSAAAAFVREAEQRRPETLDLDLTEALRGFVLAVAAQKLGSVEEAFRLFGKGSLIQHRNHKKTLRNELARVERVFEAFGRTDNPFAALSNGDE
jgi:DNA-binding NtrC family response regulator